MSSTSQRTLNDTAIPGFFDKANSSPNVPQHLGPQSSPAPASSLPPNARSLHAPLLAPYLPTTPIMLLLISPIPLLRLGPQTTHPLLLLVQVLMLTLYRGLTTHYHYPRQDIPLLQLRPVFACLIIPLWMTIPSLIPPTLPIFQIPPIPLTSTLK